MVFTLIGSTNFHRLYQLTSLNYRKTSRFSTEKERKINSLHKWEVKILS